MIRTITWFIYFAISLIFSIPSLIKAKTYDRKNDLCKRDEITYKMIRKWARSLVRLSGTKVKVVGEENIPTTQSVLFVSNHQGNFDIPLLLGFIDKPKGFIAKIETSKLPIIKTWMELMKCIFMDRNDIRQSVKSINQGIKYLKDGYSLVIFPEGTRSTDGKLGEFKPGGFKLSTKSGVPIVPITIKGSNNIMKKGSFIISPANVEIIIAPVVAIENTDIKDTTEISELVKNIIKENL